MKLSEAKDQLIDGINLICHDGTDEVSNDMDNVITISPDITLSVADKTTPDRWAELKHDDEFMYKFRLVFGDLGLPDHPLQQHGHGVRHVVGLIISTDVAIFLGMKPFWKFPESYLHPKYQLGLGDLIIHYSNAGKTNHVAQPT